MREMISNLYKIKWGEEESKYKKKKMMKCNGKIESSERQRGRRKVEEV